jgi:hypothetical protein
VTYLKAQRVFDEKRMRSVAGRGRNDNALSSKEHLDDMRGPRNYHDHGDQCVDGLADAIRSIACYSSFLTLHMGRATKPLS